MKEKKNLRTGLQLRRYFITGLITILPIWITAYILWLLFKLIGSLTKPFLKPLFELVFDKQPAIFFINLTSFFLTLFVISATGILVTYIFSKRLLLNIEKLLLGIPVIKEIYLSIRRLIQYLFIQKKKYHQVVLIEYPRKGIYTIGFVTSENFSAGSSVKNMVTIFVPTTPNPTSGFLIFCPESQLIELDISIDDAFKMLISGGLIHPKKFAKQIKKND